MRGAQTGCKADRLNGQNLLAACVALRFVARHEGRAREGAVGEVVFAHGQRKTKFARRDRAKGVHALTVVGQTLQVDIGIDHTAFE